MNFLAYSEAPITPLSREKNYLGLPNNSTVLDSRRNLKLNESIDIEEEFLSR